MKLFSRENEITFWSQQMSEHALFLHLGLEEAELKARGLELHEQWEAFRNSGGQDERELSRLMAELLAYKREVLQRLKAGEWLGWIFTSFAKHIILEAKYFISKLNNEQTDPNYEAEFWNHIIGDHAGFTAHLLDITEHELVAAMLKIQNKTLKIENEAQMFLALAIQYAKALRDAHVSVANSEYLRGQAPPSSIIHPVLLQHVIREEDRAYKTLNHILKVNSSC